MKRLAWPLAAAVFLCLSTGAIPVRALPPWDAPVAEPGDSWDEDYDKDKAELLALGEDKEQKDFDAALKVFEDQKNKTLEELKLERAEPERAEPRARPRTRQEPQK